MDGETRIFDLVAEIDTLGKRLTPLLEVDDAFLDARQRRQKERARRDQLLEKARPSCAADRARGVTSSETRAALAEISKADSVLLKLRVEIDVARRKMEKRFLADIGPLTPALYAVMSSTLDLTARAADIAENAAAFAERNQIMKPRLITAGAEAAGLIRAARAALGN